MIETPYPGLRPFRRDEVNVFFGRDRQIDAMLAVLAGEGHFLAVTGASGAGKSSLVKTGLYSALELGYMRSAGAHWRIVEARPQTHPLTELREAFIESMGADADDSIRGLIAAAVSRSPEAVAQSIGAIMEAKRESLLIVIDQFEELFRYKRTGADDEAFAFVAMLLQLAKQRKYPIYVVITVRSDYLGECAAFDGLSEAVNKALYLTPQMTRDELGEAITAPAAVKEGSVEPALVARMLNDLERERDQLPLMQHALARLWEEAYRINPEAPELTLAMYDKIGGVTGALEQHANIILAELGPRAYLAERMFRQLVGVTETADDVRNPTQFGQLLALTRSKRDDLLPVIEAFRRPDRSFLAPPEGELADDTTIDITHESLIRQWPDLRAWATAEAADASQYRRIHESARLYRKGEEGLLTSPALENALAWRDRVKPTPEWAARHMQEQTKDIRARSVRRQVEHDFVGAMAFLDESERVAKQEREATERARQKETRRLQFRAASYLALFVAALIGIVVVLVAYNNASHREQEALALKAVADTLLGDANTKLGEATDKLDEATDKLDEATGKLDEAKSVNALAGRFQANHLTANALAKYDEKDLSGAMALAAETYFLVSHSDIPGLSNEVLDRLRTGLKLSGGTGLDAPGGVEKLTDTSGFAGGNRWVGLAQTGDGWSINVWDTETGSVVNSVTLDSSPWLGSVVPGLDMAAAVDNDGEATIFSLTQSGVSRLLRDPSTTDSIYALSLGGEPGAEQAIAATFTSDYTGEVQLWDLNKVALEPVSRVALPALRTPDDLDGDDYPDTAFYDAAAGRFALVSGYGAILIGSVADNQISIDGFLPQALFDGDTRFIHFDEPRNRIVGLIDNCVFAMPLSDLVTEVPKTGETCEGPGKIVRIATKILGTRLADDGLSLIVANADSREIVDLREDHFGESLQYVSYLDQDHLALDVDLAGGTIVGNDTELNSVPTIYRSVMPGASLPCEGICKFVARIDADDFIYGDSGNTSLQAIASLWRVHTGVDGTIAVFPVGQEDYDELVGVSRDGTMVALANSGRTQIRRYQLDDNKLLGPVAISTTQAPGSGAGSGEGMTVVIGNVREEGDTLLGTKFTFSDAENWPSFVVPPSPVDASIRPDYVVAYAGATDWLAKASEAGLQMIVRGTAVPPITDFVDDQPTALTFTADGKALLVGTQRGVVWMVTSLANGISKRTVLNAGVLDSAIDTIDVVGNDVVATGRGDYPSVVWFKLDASEAPEELEGLAAKWAGKVPSGILTMGVGASAEGTPATLDRLQVWKWISLAKTPEERALAVVTAQSTKVSTERLQELYFIPDDLKASFRAHFGSDACAEEATHNQTAGTGSIGCREALKESPLAGDVVLGHGLELLQSESAFSIYAPATFSGLPPAMEGGQTTDSIEEGQLFIIAAAAAGDPNALAVLADQMSPSVATSLTADGSTYSDRALVPTTDWSITLDLLNRIYATGGPLPSAVLTLVSQPPSSKAADEDMDPKALELVIAAEIWRDRVKDPKYASDPVAQLAQILRADRGAMTSEELLSIYAKIMVELDRPADQRASGIAKQRLAALANTLGAQRVIDAVEDAQSKYSGRDVASGSVTLDPAMQAYVAALGEPAMANELRPAAVAATLSGFLDMLTPETRSALPPHIELRAVTAVLDANEPVDSLAALADQIVARVDLLDMDYKARSLVSALLLQLDSKQAVWRTDLERAVLRTYAGLIGTDDMTYDQEVMAAAMRTLARGRDVTLGAEQQAAYDAVEHLILRNFDAALDGFSYDSERLSAFNAQLGQLAAVTDAVAPGQDTLTLAMKAVITASDETVLNAAPALIDKYLANATDNYWARNNWAQTIAGYTSHAQAFRQDDARNGDPDAIRAEIALVRTGLDLDDRLTNVFSPGVTERLDRASALQVLARLQSDLAGELRDQKDETAAVQTYGDALATATSALNFRLAGYNGSSYYGSTMDQIRETYAMMATVYDRLGDATNSVLSMDNAVSYGRQAYDYDKSSTYLENYFTALTDRLLYLSKRPPAEAMPVAQSTFDALAAMDSYDRNQARAGYVGVVLSRIAYVLGSQWYELHQTELVPDQCDILAASPYDPFRRTPGVAGFRLDPIPAIAACQATLDAAVGASDFDRGRILYQLGRVVEAAEGLELTIGSAPSISYYDQAAALGYPTALIYQLGDATPADDGYYDHVVTFYNLTLQAIGEDLAVYFVGLGTSEGQATADWLQLELSRVDDVHNHWFVTDDYYDDYDEGDY